MAKNLKVTVKNSQLAEALKLTKVKKGPSAAGAKKVPSAEQAPPAKHEEAIAAAASTPPVPVVEEKAAHPPRKKEKEMEEEAPAQKRAPVRRPAPPPEEEKAPVEVRSPVEEAPPPPRPPREQVVQTAEKPDLEERIVAKQARPETATLPTTSEAPAASPVATTSSALARPKIGTVRPPLAPPPGMRPSFGERAPADRFVSPPKRTGAGPSSGGYAGNRPNRFAPPGTGSAQGAGRSDEERRYNNPPAAGTTERRYEGSQPRTGGYEKRPHANGYQGGAPGAHRPYTPRTGTSGYGTPRPQGGGYAPRAPGSGGYTPRPAGGYGGPRPAGAGYAGQRPRPPGAAGGFRSPPGARPPLGVPPPGEKPSTERRDERGKMPTFKEFREVKSQRKTESGRGFDARDRQGRREGDEDVWKRKRPTKGRAGAVVQEEIIRPKTLAVHLPITVKDLASEMKLKASEIISKLFIQGIPLTLNELLDDETTVQLIGNEFDCEISIDRTEQNRVQVTAQSVREEVASTPAEELTLRCPVVAFMGHVDHGKTSLIDRIRKSNMAAGEAGAITQHIGAFRCHTNVGDLTVLDTPGHEAFSAMRSRGAIITDIVVLVVAGDEGIRAQTEEAINQAREAGVPIVVAMNKCDKPGFDRDSIYRQLADHELLPEAWGGQTIATACSATTGEGVPQLLEMLALQAEVLELKANPKARARGTVIESQMHKGLGAVASVLVQNGTLRLGDALVFGDYYARVKTMQDEHGLLLTEAGPSTPVKITGLSGLPQAGSEFVVVKDEKEARSISEARQEGKRHLLLKSGKSAILEKLKGGDQTQKKSLNLIVKGDVRGSVEALRSSLMKIHSTKVELNIITAEVGEISESDVQLAAASKATILGFHTQIESHAEQMIKQSRVVVKLHDIIYHAVDEVKKLMLGMLDKVAQERDTGSAEVLAVFKSSQLGLIAGCRVIDGTIHRNNMVRQLRDGEQVWKGALTSMKRVRDDVREVSKGVECGILLQNNNDVKVGDILQAYEMIYLDQEL